jgi:D-alanine-D-alanine ligase
VWEHASVGLDDDSVFQPESYRDLTARLEETERRLGGKCFAEAYIEGREFNISLLAGPQGAEVLPPAEIHFMGYAEGKPRVVGYPAKWHAESFEYQNTPRSFDFPAEDAPLLRRLEALSRACWRLFGLRGYARVDVRVDEGGCPWVLEINANPCLSPDAGFAAALERGGIPFVDAVDRIVRASRFFGVR